jgi:hypothetical protein
MVRLKVNMLVSCILSLSHLLSSLILPCPLCVMTAERGGRGVVMQVGIRTEDPGSNFARTKKAQDLVTYDLIR